MHYILLDNALEMKKKSLIDQHLSLRESVKDNMYTVNNIKNMHLRLNSHNYLIPTYIFTTFHCILLGQIYKSWWYFQVPVWGCLRLLGIFWGTWGCLGLFVFGVY